MAENFILDIIAGLQEAASKAKLDSDIKSIQKQLGKLELKAGIDPKSIAGIQKKMEGIKIKAQLAPDAVENLVRQLEGLENTKVILSNIGIDQRQAVKEGKQVGEGIDRGLSASLNTIRHSISNVMKEFSGDRLKSYDLSKMFNLNRAGIDSSVLKRVRDLTNEVNSLSMEVLKTGADASWDGVIQKINSLSKVLNQFGKNRDLSPFKESLDVLDYFQGKKIFVGDKSEVLQNTGMGIRELNNQFRNLGITLTTVSEGSTKLDTVWTELFNIAPGLQQFETFGDQLNAVVSHFKAAKEAMYGHGNLRPLNGGEVSGVLAEWMGKLDEAAKKMAVLKAEEAEIEQQVARQSSSAAENVVNNEKKKQEAYQQTANAQKKAADQTQQAGAAYKSMGDTASNAIKRVGAEQSNMEKQGKSLAASLKESMSFLAYWTSPMFLMVQAVAKVKQAFTELKSVNTIMTEISKVSEMTSHELKKLGDSAFEAASKYGKKASDYLTGIQEFSRAGFRGQDAGNMAELSVLTQAAGDINADLSDQYLISTDAAYKLNGEASKLNEILDGQNYIANNNAASMEHLARATKVAASQAASSGVAVEELSAAIGTMVAVTQDSGDVAGRAFKAILMNLQQVSGELDDGEVIDEESLTKYEKACNGLGVSLKEVKNGVVSLREPMQILKELSEAYTSLDKMDARRANLISAIGGKHRGNQLNALLENWQMYEKMLVDYSNGSGSAMNEAMKSANSWEGSLNRLHNTWVKTVQNIAGSDAIITIINGTNSLLDVLDKLTSKLGSIGTIGLGAFAFINKGRSNDFAL